MNNLDRLAQSSIQAAQDILGWELVRQLPGGEIHATITETEAYHAQDQASHSFSGKTERNKSMFLAAGHAYIYRIYGSHYCLNVVTGHPEEGEAILIRSVVVTKGLELAMTNRHHKMPLASGPGRLCQALRIDRTLDGHDLRLPPLQVFPKPRANTVSIIATPRIGIAKAASELLRFVLE